MFQCGPEASGVGSAIPGPAAAVLEASEAVPERRPLRRGLLGQLLVREGLVTQAQLEEALRVQREQEPGTPLGQILVRAGVITQRQLERILDRYRKKYRLGDILVETEAITEEQLQIALDHQRKTGLRLGEALLQLNFVTEEELDRALCTQFGITFVDLDRLVLDRSAAELVDVDFAQMRRVIPVARAEGILVVAMEDPSDLTTVDELGALVRSKVNVITSTSAAFQRAFTRVYGESRDTGLARRWEDLHGAYERLRQERDAQDERLAELASRNVANEETLAELQRVHRALRRERDAEVQGLLELRGRHEAIVGTLAEREAACATLAQERDTLAGELRALRAAHAALREEHEEAARKLRESHGAVVEDRVQVVDQLETLIRRLKS